MGYQPKRCKHSNMEVGDKRRVKLDKHIQIVDKTRPLKLSSAGNLTIGANGRIDSRYQIANGQWANEYVCLAADVGAKKQVNGYAVTNDLNKKNKVEGEPCGESNHITFIWQCRLDMISIPRFFFRY